MADTDLKKDGFTLPSSIKNRLTGKLIPVADRLRDLHTKFGGRNYIVRIIRTKWTGGRRGLGSEVFLRELVILPTPLVVDLDSLTEVTTPIGLNESGGLQISEISGRYTEEQLRGLDSHGVDTPIDEQVFYEVEFPRSDGKPAEKRRFFIRSAPSYKPYRFQWMVMVEKTNHDRDRGA